MNTTIFALASAPGRAGVAVFRLSGPNVADVWQKLSNRVVAAPRKASLLTLSHDGEVIDEALGIYFQGPNSFTGEDVVELHTHGGRAVQQALTKALLDLGLRPAEAGEFSKRAFLAGKMDLTKAEAIADLVDAETAAQRRQALKQMDGGLARLTDDWRARMVKNLALMEAVIDFSDEGVPDELVGHVAQEIEKLKAEMQAILADNHRGERLRDGIHIAILGAPNAGKSSLLNAIAGRDAAIVSSQAGTTRDVIEVHLDLGGWPVVLADTAGLREASEEIEAEGIRRALKRAEQADIKLCVFDASQTPDAATLQVLDQASMVVVNKSDLAGIDPILAAHNPVLISAKQGDGVGILLDQLTALVGDRFSVSEAPSITRARHRAAVLDCVAALDRFDPDTEIELATEDLRLAARAIGRITGRVDVEELLDVVFREFCIGK